MDSDNFKNFILTDINRFEMKMLSFFPFVIPMAQTEVGVPFRFNTNTFHIALVLVCVFKFSFRLRPHEHDYTAIAMRIFFPFFVNEKEIG